MQHLESTRQFVEFGNLEADDPVRAVWKRLRLLEQTIRSIEDELSDEELDDDQKLQNIGERLALIMDGQV